MVAACEPPPLPDGPVLGEGAPRVDIVLVAPNKPVSNLIGRAYHIRPEEYRIAAFLYSSKEKAWYGRPTPTDYTVEMRNDGTFSASLGAGTEADGHTQIAALLLPADTVLPEVAGVRHLPESLLDAAVASNGIYRNGVRRGQMLFFAGREWHLRWSEEPQEPGPISYADDLEHAWVDDDGALHLRMTREGFNDYKGASALLNETLGPGTVTIDLRIPDATLHGGAVFSAQTWGPDPAQSHRQLGYELRAHESGIDVTQFVEPRGLAGNLESVRLPGAGRMRHVVEWGSEVTLASGVLAEGSEAAPAPGLQTTPPTSLDENWSLSVWLERDGRRPEGQEVVVEAFEFSPLPSRSRRSAPETPPPSE